MAGGYFFLELSGYAIHSKYKYIIKAGQRTKDFTLKIAEPLSVAYIFVYVGDYSTFDFPQY